MTNRYQSMDCLRAIAILTVLLAHSVLAYGAPHLLAPLQLGGTGVDLFFVLSGWLLGCQLFKEAEKNGRIDIQRFWVRRWIRTFPAYYVVLCATIAQQFLTKDNVDFPWHYFVFIQNYNHPLEFFSVSWSLCVEEQFYLLVAPLVATTYFLNRRMTIPLLLVLFLIPFCFRLFDLYGSVEETHVRVDGCLAGVLLAGVYRRHPKYWCHLARFSPILALVGLSVYIMFYAARYNPDWGLHDPDRVVWSLIFSSWILFANSSDTARKKLRFPGSYYIATRSYGMYLLHPEMFSVLSRLGYEGGFLTYFLLILLGSAFLSEVLYRIVEKPLMDYREKLPFSSSKI